MVLRGKNPRPAIVLLASTMTVLLIAGAAAAHGMVTEPHVDATVTPEAAAAPTPDDGRDREIVRQAAEPDPAPDLPTSTSPTTRTVAPVAAVPMPATRPGPTSPTSTVVAPPTSLVAPPQTFVPPKPPPPSLETVQIGPGAWRSTFEGITATLRMTPVAPRAGQTVHFSIDTTYTGLGCCMVHFYTGDGAILLPDNNSMDCTEAPGSLHRQMSHTYTSAGEFVAHVQPSILPCVMTPEGGPSPINSHLYANISIAPST